jgi:tetratricopeptide (TPR) repeat protein
MARRKLFTLGLAISVTLAGFAFALPGRGLRAAQHGGGHHHHGRGGGFGGFGGFGVGLPYFYGPIIVMGPGMFLAPMPVGMPMGPIMPPPPPGILNGARMGNVRPARMKNADPARAAQLLIVGDRLLRAGNLKKAEERYLQAMRAAPDLAAPRVRLAQVAIARGNFADAASRLREAETAEPGWIVNAPDIQAIFGEPTDFTRQLAKLESHVQTHPDDRDAWLVLGAEWFLSGRTAKAADVFKRLDDPARKSDVALAAFLDASNQRARGPDRDR